jgi:hypothetical protein
MKSRLFVAGIVTLLFGVILFLLGYNTAVQLGTSIGQLGRLLFPELQEAYNQALVMEFGGVTLSIIGLAVAIYTVAISKRSCKKFDI